MSQDTKPNMWGISSAGRALAWHARGHRFDPGILHQKSTVLRKKYGAFLFAEADFLGLHCFACTVFRLLQAVELRPRDSARWSNLLFYGTAACKKS